MNTQFLDLLVFVYFSKYFRWILALDSFELLRSSYIGNILFTGQADPLEKEMATHSSILAWKIPWTEDPGKL